MASLIQKMISQQLFIQATPDEPQAPPLADTPILPKELDKATMAIPSKVQYLSETPDKPQVVEAGPLDLTIVKATKLLAGPCISMMLWLTVDHRPHQSTAW